MNTQLYDCEGNPVALYTKKGNIISSAKRVSKKEYDHHKEEHGKSKSYVEWHNKAIDKPYKFKWDEQWGEESNETPKEDTEVNLGESTKINLGDNIDETKLVLGDTPFLDKYIPIDYIKGKIDELEKDTKSFKNTIGQYSSHIKAKIDKRLNYQALLADWDWDSKHHFYPSPSIPSTKY